MTKEKKLEQPVRIKYFWLIAILICVFLSVTMGRKLNRPFNGMHSWAEASGAWAARTHVKYGLGYTKGVSTWAVGDPPTETPNRYLDHPQLAGLVSAGIMKILGIHEWTFRVINVALSVLTTLLFIKILRGLVDDWSALVTGFVFVMFPLHGYFGTGGWVPLLGFISVWCYLVIIGKLSNAPNPTKLHYIGLIGSLFLSLQFGWHGFFFAFAIGVHYVAGCLFSKRWPQWKLLTILAAAPLSSLMMNFLIMAWFYAATAKEAGMGLGYGFGKIWELYTWRAAKGEMQHLESFDWGLWFAKLWEFAETNFTLAVLIAAIAFLTVGQLIILLARTSDNKKIFAGRGYPEFWLFFIIPVSQLLSLRGALWRHQTWERPLGPFIAIAAGMAVMLIFALFKKLNKKVGVGIVVIILGVFTATCVKGTNYYYGIRWQPIEKIEMFEKLNQQIPPDKALLSYEPLTVNQHKAKGTFYRPEIAWYLDRDIVVATTFDAVQEKGKTGRYPYYLVLQEAPASQDTIRLSYWARQPNLTPQEQQRRQQVFGAARSKEVQQWQIFLGSLAKLYKYEIVKGVRGETKYGTFFRAGMNAYIIFDLQSQAGSPANSTNE